MIENPCPANWKFVPSFRLNPGVLPALIFECLWFGHRSNDNLQGYEPVYVSSTHPKPSAVSINPELKGLIVIYIVEIDE